MKSKGVGSISPWLRLFLIFLLASWLAPGSGAKAAPVSPVGGKRIVILESGGDEAVRQHTRWFKAQLHDLGYREGLDLDLVVLKAEGDHERAIGLLRQAIIAAGPDVVVTNGLPASRQGLALLAPLNIPQVFCNVADPAGAGLVGEDGRSVPEGVTGVVPAIEPATGIDLAMRLAGQVVSGRPVRIGYIHANDEAALGDLRALSAVAATRRDVVFLPYPPLPAGAEEVPADDPAAADPATADPAVEIRAPFLTPVAAAVNALDYRVDFWWEPAGPSGKAEEFTRPLLEQSLRPILMGAGPASVRQGALLAVTPSVESSGRAAALLAERILRGVDPGVIVPVRPATFDLTLNLTTAIKLGITVPVEILELAGERIYR